MTTYPHLQSPCPQGCRLRPDALRLPEYLEVIETEGTRTCPPCCRMVGGGEMGKASPYCAGAQFGSFPLSAAGRSRGIVQGATGPAEPSSSRVHRSTPAHPPVAALLPLGGALGWLPAVAPMVQQGQPGTAGREGDKSVEAVPRPVVDVQPCAKAPGNG